jgi:hypothetical protein
MDKPDRIVDKMERLSALQKSEVPLSEKRYKDASKRKLANTIEKKIKTTFIGAIAQFENFFGKEWGHGKTDDEKTELEAIAYEIWQQCRTVILNNGNNQIRAIENELEQYDIKWNRHQVNLEVKNGGKS